MSHKLARLSDRYDWQPPKFGKKEVGEVTCFSFSINEPNVTSDAFMKDLKSLQTRDGFCGIYPYLPYTIAIFRNQEQAEQALKVMDRKGYKIEGGVKKCFVEKQYLPKG